MWAFWEEQAGKGGEGAACYMREQWECMELYPRWMWSQWRTYGSGLGGRWTWVMLWCVCHRLQDQEADDAFFRKLEEASSSQALVLVGALTTLIAAGSATQQGTSRPGGFWSALMVTFWQRWLTSWHRQVPCWTSHPLKKKLVGGSPSSSDQQLVGFMDEQGSPDKTQV